MSTPARPPAAKAPRTAEFPDDPAAPTTTTNTQPDRFPALTHPGSHLRFWSVAIIGLTVDLWSKEWAFHTLLQNGRRVLIPYVLEFQTMLNPGALFGVGSGRTGLFLLASLLALALVLWMFAQSPPRRWALQIALGAILAGALGNMYDRMFIKLVPVATSTRPLYMQPIGEQDGRVELREYPQHPDGLVRYVDQAPTPVGFVRDFIKIPTTVRGRELWPWVFNVADVLLVCGVATLAIYLWRDRKSHRTEPAAIPQVGFRGGGNW